MRRYSNNTTATSRAELMEARQRVGEEPERLSLEAFRLAKHVHAKVLDYWECFDGLWLTAKSAGQDGLEAHATICRAFSQARSYQFAELREGAPA